MSPRGPYGEGSTVEKRLASSSNVLQVDLDCGGLTAGRTRWHEVTRAPELRWQNKYLLPGTVALIIYGIIGLRLHVPFALLFATSGTKPVAGQCPSYADYSKVGDALDSFLRRYRHSDPRSLTEHRPRVYWVSHICDRIPLVGHLQAPSWR